MAGGLTYANTMGAINGINQSGSGVTIPDTFLRWAQDVLFDNNGVIKRRAPFSVFKLYDTLGNLTQPGSSTALSISTITSTSNTVTVTFLVTHNLSLYQPIIVSNVANNNYNGTFIVATIPSSTQITYVTTASGTGSSSGGTIIPATERVISTISTLNPVGDRITGIVVTSNTNSRILFYDTNFRGPYVSPLSSIITQDSIFDVKQASVSGMWLSFLESYAAGSSTNDYYQYYWRGGCGVETTFSNCTFETSAPTSYNISSITASSPSAGSVTVTLSTTHTILVGQSITISGVTTTTAYNGTYTVTAVGASTVTFASSTTGTATVTGATLVNNSTTTYTNKITGSFGTTFPAKGMFVYRTVSNVDYYIGVVASADSGTIFLEKDIIRTTLNSSANLNSSSQTIKVVNIRPYIKNHSRGLLSLTTGTNAVGISGTTGTDGEGHWKSAGIDSTWALYRASDGEWLGDVGSVSDNSTLTMSTTYYPASSITNKADEYIARPYTALPAASLNTRSDTTSAGIFIASYAGLQWFGNGASSLTRNRIVFSNYLDPESVDLSANDADSIIIPSLSEMRGLASSSSGLLIFMADKTFLLRGNSRFNFSLEELYPEGCLSSMSIVEYGGGVFWASRNGIYYYDGVTVRNLTKENLGNYYSQSIKDFNILYDRVYGFFHKDYLFMHITAWNSVYQPIRYEPIYADSITNTPAIEKFIIDDWDPDFTIEDFDVNSNTPIYWSYNKMYSSGGASIGNTSGTITGNWGPGWSVKSVSGNGTTATLTLSSVYSYSVVNGAIVATPLAIGNSITVSGLNATTGTYNGTYLITNVSIPNNTISYTATGTGSPSTTGATVSLSSNLAGSPYWGSVTSQLLWGPPDTTEGATFAIYIPTGAITYLSNFSFRGATKVDSATSGIGLKALMGVNINDSGYYYPRIVDVDTIFNTDIEYSTSTDEVLIENNGIASNNYRKGPDFYIQTKHYTMGDPLLKKWFRQLFLNLYLIDGCLRLDIVDNEDNDEVDVRKKRHKTWELFTSISYTWNQLENNVLPRILSPNRSTWENVENLGLKWYELTNTAFERRKKKFSWRYPSFGFRLYQINNYRPNKFTLTQAPFNVILESWDIGFKPMRQSRI